MSAPQLLAELEQRGLSLSVVDGALRVQGPKGLLTDELRQQLAAGKPELLAHLQRPQVLADTAVTAEPEADPARWRYFLAYFEAAHLQTGNGVKDCAGLSLSTKNDCRRRANLWAKGQGEAAELSAWLGCDLAQLLALRERHEQRNAANQEGNADAEETGIKRQWAAEMQALIDWFQGWNPPTESFRLKPGVTIANPPHWAATIRGDIGAGVNGARARYGALQSDLATLKRLFTGATCKES